MATRHSLSKRLAQGTAILALSLLLQPCSAQGSKTSPTPVAKKTNAQGPADAGTARKKTPKSASPLQIAVVDIELAARAHPSFETRTKELAKWGRAQSAKLNELKKAIQTKQAQLNNTVQPGSAAANELQIEISKLNHELKLRRQLINQTGLAREAKLMLSLQNQVSEAIAELASRRGIHLVLRRRMPIPKAGLQQQFNLSQSTDVLYASASLDITQDIIDLLKTKYQTK